MIFIRAVCYCAFVITSVAAAASSPNSVDPGMLPQTSADSGTAYQEQIDELKRQLIEQQKQIEELRAIVRAQLSSNESKEATPVNAAHPEVSAGPHLTDNALTVSAPQAGKLLTPNNDQAASQKSDLPPVLKHFKPLGLAYISYQAGLQDSGPHQTQSYNLFLLKRGYFGADVDITSYLTSRFISDVTLDTFGDVKLRSKYLYGKFHAKGNNAITAPYMEFGLDHMPWLDFEEAINGFRMQDTMFLERNNIFNSADFGVLVGSDIGGSMDSEYKNTVDSHYAGRYGSWQLGVYNGGGYHAAEQNTNKVVEGRLSIRPVPRAIPGLQLTAFGLTGKGNKPATSISDPPDWSASVAMLSYESRYLTFTGQAYAGTGNQAGTALQSNGTSARQSGFSVFAAVHIPAPLAGQRISVLGRIDEFNSNTRIANDLQRLYIAGVAWHFYKDNIWLIDYQRTSHSVLTRTPEDRLQVTLQTVF
jgi:hypothetical protein